MDGISEKEIGDFITAALQEDVGNGDHTSLACIDPSSISTAWLYAKDDGIIAGVELAQKIFTYLDPSSEFEVLIDDGGQIKYKDIVFKVTCNSQALLKGERLALNAMQRMSGIATMSDRFLAEVEDLPITILD